MCIVGDEAVVESNKTDELAKLFLVCRDGPFLDGLELFLLCRHAVGGDVETTECNGVGCKCAFGEFGVELCFLEALENFFKVLQMRLEVW